MWREAVLTCLKALLIVLVVLGIRVRDVSFVGCTLVFALLSSLLLLLFTSKIPVLRPGCCCFAFQDVVAEISRRKEQSAVVFTVNSGLVII
jgi:hypothetical protein